MSDLKLRIASVVDDSVVDGPGVRYVIFTQGCKHNCPGCHNPQSHSFSAGMFVGFDEIYEDLSKYKYVKAVTFSGGEPLEQPEAVAEFVSKLKEKGYHILIYTGYTFEQILADEKKLRAIEKADLLVDGLFVLRLRSLNVNFRGSSNQRIVDVQRSLKNKEVVLSEYN
ncbi:MAG: anaerobic ribonucleoside-triphosphate reductase activating protein [Alphaproteobacteria bacterium]|nr:anaerobic ribonucleoside-triphosphate reductase activating protein [Alphaproteobacteria bacterium]